MENNRLTSRALHWRILSSARIFDPRCYPLAMPRQFDGPAMDLANMRSLGVRSIFATCDCGRAAAVDVSELPGAVEVPALRWRLRCSCCGSRPVDVRPDWREHRARGVGR